MSYINFTFQREVATSPAMPPLPQSTLDVGFSREGGRVDHLVRVVGNETITAPLDDPSIQQAASALRDALLGASWTRHVQETSDAQFRPSSYNWIDRDGTRSAASHTQLDPHLQHVVAAAQALDKLVASYKTPQ